MRHFIISFLMLFLACGVYAQEPASNKSVLGKFHGEFGASAAVGSQKMKEWSGMCAISYDLTPRLYALAQYEAGQTTRKQDGVRSFMNTQALGGGLGFKLATVDNLTCDLRAKVLSHVGNSEWKKTSYCIGLNWEFSGSARPMFGLEYRYNKSHSAGIPNTNALCGTVAIRF